MPFRVIFPVLFILSTLCSAVNWAVAQTPSGAAGINVAADVTVGVTAGSMTGALAHYQKGELPEAEAAFQTLLKAEPDNVVLLYNLGLVEQKLGNLGPAIGLWRRAVSISEDFLPAAQALAFTIPKLEHPEIAHEVLLWESLRSSLLVNQSLNRYLLLTALSLFVSGWLLLRYFGRRRRSFLDEKPLPGPPLAGILVAFLFAVSASLCIAKAVDGIDMRGTVVVKSITARSAPEAEATALFDLYEGLEVIVRKKNGDWLQVAYPGGSTGWVPSTAILSNRPSPDAHQQAQEQAHEQEKAAK